MLIFLQFLLFNLCMRATELAVSYKSGRQNDTVKYILNRVTSGLVVLAKSKEAAARLSKEIRDKSTKKTYLARVKGMFPKNILKFRMTSLDDVLNVPTEDDDDDDEDDSNGNSNKQKNKQSNNQKDNEKDKLKQSEKDKQKSRKRNHEGALKESDVSESDLPPRVREIPSLEEVVGSGRVGCHVDVLTGDVSLRCPIGTAFMQFTTPIHPLLLHVILLYFILFNFSYYIYLDLLTPSPPSPLLSSPPLSSHLLLPPPLSFPLSPKLFIRSD